MFQYRDHKGGPAESMETKQCFKNKRDLLKYLQDILNRYDLKGIDVNKTIIEPYGFDERIGWNNHIVHLDGWGVFGFTNKAI